MNYTAVTEARIDHICKLMRGLKWRTGKTGHQLAKKWEVGIDTIERLSSIASKRVKAELTDPDRVTIKLTAALDEVIDSALHEMRHEAVIEKDTDDGTIRLRLDPNKARRSINDAAKTMAALIGVQAPTRIEATMVGAEASTPAEAKRLMAELFGGPKQVTDAPGPDRAEDVGNPPEGASSE